MLSDIISIALSIPAAGLSLLSPFWFLISDPTPIEKNPSKTLWHGRTSSPISSQGLKWWWSHDLVGLNECREKNSGQQVTRESKLASLHWQGSNAVRGKLCYCAGVGAANVDGIAEGLSIRNRSGTTNKQQPRAPHWNSSARGLSNFFTRESYIL